MRSATTVGKRGVQECLHSPVGSHRPYHHTAQIHSRKRMKILHKQTTYEQTQSVDGAPRRLLFGQQTLKRKSVQPKKLQYSPNCCSLALSFQLSTSTSNAAITRGRLTVGSVPLHCHKFFQPQQWSRTYPQKRTLFQLQLFFFFCNQRHLSSPYQVEILPARENVFRPPYPPWDCKGGGGGGQAPISVHDARRGGSGDLKGGGGHVGVLKIPSKFNTTVFGRKLQVMHPTPCWRGLCKGGRGRLSAGGRV